MPTHDQRLTSAFHPQSDRPSRKRDRLWATLTRELKARDLAIGLLAILIALGWTITSPGKKIDALDARVTKNEKRLDTLAEQQRFTNYLLCVQIRRTDPQSAPPDCIPIIESRHARP